MTPYYIKGKEDVLNGRWVDLDQIQMITDPFHHNHEWIHGLPRISFTVQFAFRDKVVMFGTDDKSPEIRASEVDITYIRDIHAALLTAWSTK